MAKVAITYCAECMFLGRALEVGQTLLEMHADRIDALEIVPGSEGVFTVTVNDQAVYRIGEEGLPPLPDEIEDLVRGELQKESG